MDNAVETCQHVNANLVLPRSEQEDTDLYNAFKALGVNSGALDATDVAKEGEWVDSAGQPLTYFNWFKNQPSNSHGQDHYLNYNSAMNGQWNDSRGFVSMFVVCEKPVKSRLFHGDYGIKLNL